MYSRLICEIDAGDNGISPYKHAGPEFSPLFSYHTDLSFKVGMLNVRWYEELTPELELERFNEGVKLCLKEWNQQLEWVVKV